MEPSTEFGTDPPLSPNAGNVFFRIHGEAAGDGPFGKKEGAREAWLKGTEQRQASWIEVWVKSVLGKTPIGSSDIDGFEIIGESSAQSKVTDEESTTANTPNLPEG
jgi:hypothetical protein